ncbi:major head protein [Yersinia phage fHe-Yen8-01]|nr:major head protein [Yersinia phage fHe-Yen8-01]
MDKLAQLFQNSLPGGAAALGGSMGGNLAQFDELTKALQASDYQTDVSKLEGGGALGVQSLDTAMKTTIQENKHFTLFNMLQQTQAINIVDEFSRQSSVGGFLGGSTNTQMGVVRAAQGQYEREVGLVKFLMSLRQVGYVLNIGKNISEPIAVEERNGALQLLTDANYLLYHGNAEVVDTQFDGVFAQIDKEIANGKMSGESRVDMDGKPMNTIEPMSQITVQASSYGNWGQSTDIFLPNSVQNDLNLGLDPAYRWMPDGQNTPIIGGQVNGIRLTTGILKTHMDTFIHDETNPMVHVFELTNPNLAADNVNIKVATVTSAKAANNASKFRGNRAGAYVYAVAGVSKSGAGMAQAKIVPAVTVADGEAVTLTITNPNNTDLGGYAIYRGRQDVAAGASDNETLRDLRLVKIIPADISSSAAGKTAFVDLNTDIPGTVCVPMLNLAPGADAIGWRQFQPMTKIPLPFGVGGMPVMSWFQFLFGYLRVTKPKHHGYIKNVLPTQAKWRPHTSE